MIESVKQILSRHLNVCAFRMALKDLKSGDLSAAASRIASDLDKVDRNERKTLIEFIQTSRKGSK